MPTITPLYETVQVHLAGTRQDELSLIGTVVDALERAQQGAGADAFLRAAAGCRSEDDLLALAHRTVTVL